jgi:hypothetical protein
MLQVVAFGAPPPGDQSSTKKLESSFISKCYAKAIHLLCYWHDYCRIRKSFPSLATRHGLGGIFIIRSVSPYGIWAQTMSLT